MPHTAIATAVTTPADPLPQPLVAASFPLWGSRLIEASAGTGKTWTIAALYLRLVLGHGDAEQGFGRPLEPSDILVMTFTRAATRELSDRIRSRLLEAARCFRGEQLPAAADSFLAGLLAQYPPGAVRSQAAWRLANAAEGMDDASVHTIDAWCQRMLREHAFDSGNLFDEELVADEQALLTEAVQDHWRTTCYPLPATTLAQVLAIWKDIPTLRSDVAQLIQLGVPAATADQPLAALIADWLAPIAPLLAERKQQVAAMQEWLMPQLNDFPAHWNGTKLKPATVEKWFATLTRWAEQPHPLTPPDLDKGLTRLTPDGLLDARKAKAPPLTGLPPAFAWFQELMEALTARPLAPLLRQHAAVQVGRRLLHLKRQSGSFGFADMLQRLDTALAGEHGERLRQRILAQYPVALIDEFQDTSPLQYSLFNRIYDTQANARDRALLLIGDPKQSIYGFRGADIHSYLQARAATQGRHYALDVNYRSIHALVQAVNHCFGQAEHSQPQAAFLFKTASGNPLPFVAVQAQGRAEQLHTASGPVHALTLEHDLDMVNVQTHLRRFAERCAQRIVTWLNDPQAGFVLSAADTDAAEHAADADGGTAPATAPPFQRLRPRDIAVLVRTGKEAAAVRRALQRRGVASVYLSDKDSVFQSEEARDLVHWLRGVATPADALLVRAALAVRSVDLSLAELHRLATDDEAFDQRSQHMRELQTVWHSQGVLAMLRQSLHRFGLAARWLQQPDGERRLTNFLHLAELLQTASSDLEGEQALIRWLERQISESARQNDEQVVRLESDADLVKLITVHKSKGLEYPVVCLPFGTSFRAVNRKYVKAASLPADGGQRRLVLELTEDDLAQADTERLREDLRLLYVALTRPRHALWVGFSALKIGNAKACQTHQSALGSLLGGHQPVDAEDWEAKLQALADGCTHIHLQAASDHTAFTRLQPQASAAALHPAQPYTAQFDRDWTVASYSRLTRDLKNQPATGLSPMHTPRPADDERLPAGSADALPSEAEPAWGAPMSAVADGMLFAPLQIEAASAVPAVGAASLQPIWHSFKRGPLSGNFLHDQLEWLAGERFALADNPALAHRLKLRCERAGYAEQAEALVAWLQAVVLTPLGQANDHAPATTTATPAATALNNGSPATQGPGVALADLANLRPELEFWLPAHRLSVRTVDALCHAHVLPGTARPALQASVLHGMLMGFADLVFEHAGRYWVLDYKSNHLGPDDSAYTAPALQAAMAHHRYDVQATIYLLALHRLLRQRLGDGYQPAQHLGGAVYYFVRGIHGPTQGVCLLPAPLAALDQLDAMLNGTVTEGGAA